MAQFQWTVLSHNGSRNDVGIYHGSDSGHVLIYCNDEIVKIDFSVLDDKAYNFYIDDELYELQIESVENEFAYGLRVNKEVQTPLNEALDQAEKSEINYLVIGMIGFIVLMIILSLLFNYFFS